MVKKQDEIYASALKEVVDFKFDERVASVFPDMIERSVPGYSTLISSIGILAGRYAQDNTHCYDLGCSVGAVSLSIRHRLRAIGCQIIAVDNSPEMIAQGQLLLERESKQELATPIKMLCSDIEEVDINNASIVVLNFTLQFIAVEERLALVKRIYDGLTPGGVLILSEKVAFDDQIKSDFMIDAHHDFKRENGYSDLEISQKRTALEKVMISETLTCHKQRLSDAGFGFSSIWFQCFNFTSIIAIK